MDVTSFPFNLYRSYYAQTYRQPFAAKSLSNAPSLPHWGKALVSASYSVTLILYYSTNYTLPVA